MTGKLKVGVIGAGSWAVSSHIPNLLSRPEAELTVVNRPEPELAERIKEKFGFRHAAVDYREALAQGPDVVVVSSPAAFHYEHAKAALEAGAHVLCEKPFTLEPTHAWELQRIASEKKLHLVVAFGFNYKRLAATAKEWMEEGAIGTIEAVMLHMASPIRQLLLNAGSYYGAAGEFDPQPSTWTDPRLSGGGYAPAQLSHALGLGLWLSGLRGADVFARTHHAGGSVDLHDAYSIRFTNGSIGTVFGASTPAGVKKHQLELRLFGERGHLHLDLERERLWLYRGESDQKLPVVEEDEGLYDCAGPVHTLLDLALGKEAVNRSPAELGARTVEIIDAAYRSAGTQRSESIQTKKYDCLHCKNDLR